MDRPYLLLSEDEWATVASRRFAPGCSAIYTRLVDAANGHLQRDFSQLQAIAPWWRIFAWHNSLLELVLAAQVTGDVAYRQHAITLLRDLAAGPDCGYATFERHVPHGAGMVLIAVCLVYDLAYAELSESERTLLVGMIVAGAEQIWESSLNRNWGDHRESRQMWNHAIVGYAALAYAARALAPQTHPLQEAWSQRAEPYMGRFLRKGLTAGGPNREGFSYAGVTLKALAYMLKAMQRGPALSSEHGTQLDQDILARINQYVEYVAYEILPCGGLVQNFNDSDMDPRLGINGYLLLNTFVDNPVAKFAWDRAVGPHGDGSYGSDEALWRSSLFEAYLFFPSDSPELTSETVPLPTTRHFEEKGYVVSRTGWGDHDSVLAFSSGPGTKGVHQQADHNSFTWSVDGTPLIVDSGPANSPDEGSPSQSLGHNSVLIDGRGMAICGVGAYTHGRIVQHVSHPDYDYVQGDAKRAYNRDAFNPTRRALRHICFVKRPAPYCLVWDDIEAADGLPHDYTFVLHLAAGFVPDVAPSRETFRFRSPRAPALKLGVQFLDGLPVSHEQRQYVNRHATSDPLVHKHPMQLFTRRASSPGFVVLLTAAEAPAIPRVLSLKAISLGTQLVLQWPTDAGEASADSFWFPGPQGGSFRKERSAAQLWQ